MPDNHADRRRREIVAEIAQLGFCLPGSVVDRTSRCGNPNCRCHADPAHRHGPYRSWTRKVAGKTVTRRLTDDQLLRYQLMAPVVFVHPFRSNPYSDSGVFVHPPGQEAM